MMAAAVMAAAAVETVEMVVARSGGSPTRGDGRGWCAATTLGPATPMR